VPKSAERPVFFPTQESLRRWYRSSHQRASALWLGFHKVHTGKPSVTYREALDEALCFGWIDGVRRSLGADAWSIRFLPRVRKANWSLVNIRRARELIAEGRMSAAGLQAFEHRDEAKASQAHHGRRQAVLDAASERQVRGNAKAWTFWNDQPPSYRTPAAWWVISAKKPETRSRRLEQLIAHSAHGRRIPMLTPPSKR
jgi:uncharacterized protein YdeI (YjbR/CyaY-like superfamily)